MIQTARMATSTPYMSTGFVQATHDDVYTVAGDMGLLRARRAAGCLLAPRKGDRVLLLLDTQALSLHPRRTRL